MTQELGGRIGYFFFYFSALGRGRGSPRRQERVGVGFLLKMGGAFSRRGGTEGRGREGVGGEFGGGGAKFFFRGRNSHQENDIPDHKQSDLRRTETWFQTDFWGLFLTQKVTFESCCHDFELLGGHFAQGGKATFKSLSGHFLPQALWLNGALQSKLSDVAQTYAQIARECNSHQSWPSFCSCPPQVQSHCDPN